jgi:hypothetical protein
MSEVMGPLTRRMLSEEVLAALHIIVAIMLFREGWAFLAWVFVARAVIDEVAALTFGWRALRAEPDKEPTP